MFNTEHLGTVIICLWAPLMFFRRFHSVTFASPTSNSTFPGIRPPSAVPAPPLPPSPPPPFRRPRRRRRAAVHATVPDETIGRPRQTTMHIHHDPAALTAAISAEHDPALRRSPPRRNWRPLDPFSGLFPLCSWWRWRRWR